MLYLALSFLSNAVFVLAQLGAGSISVQLSYQPELPEYFVKNEEMK